MALSETQTFGASTQLTAPPFWVKLLRFTLALSFFFLLPLIFINVAGWKWISEHFSNLFIVFLVTEILVSIVVSILWVRSKPVLYLLNLVRKDKNLVHRSFFREQWKPVSAFAVVLVFALFDGFLYRRMVQQWPLPRVANRIQIRALPPQKSEGLIPVYFWDYATWIDPKFIQENDIIVPYEKGPPQKLLAKVFFQNRVTKLNTLELHGKRPRSYKPESIYNLFTDSGSTTLFSLSNYNLLFKLLGEAGLAESKIEELHLYRIDQSTSNTTQAIGDLSSGRFFFWGPDGSVFQVFCLTEGKQCATKRMLELVQFPQDPQGSYSDRMEWTAGTLKGLLTAPLEKTNSPKARDQARFVRTNLIRLYLISLLTLDPRDPEAFFHLGKMSENKETLAAAIRYGKDLGLEHPKILELQTMLEKE